MEWSTQPEVTMKAGAKAPFEGILMPEMNYRNYKAFEDMSTATDSFLKTSGLPCSDPDWITPVLWGVVGFAVGAMAFRK
jgi:hypothetical protein